MSPRSGQEPQPFEEPVEESSSAPAHEEIERRAYELWQTRARDGIEGTAIQDWLTAELELSKESA